MWWGWVDCYAGKNTVILGGGGRRNSTAWPPTAQIEGSQHKAVESQLKCSCIDLPLLTFNLFKRGWRSQSASFTQAQLLTEPMTCWCVSNRLTKLAIYAQSLSIYLSIYLVGWDCRIRRLHLCERVRSHQLVLWKEHLTNWLEDFTPKHPEYIST